MSLSSEPETAGLAGGVGNGGAVVRIGDTVRRPAVPLARAVATHLEAAGFERAPRFLGVDGEGRDVFTFVAGEVAVAPYPDWARRDEILREVGGLLRDFHEAMAGFDPGTPPSPELADPAGLGEADPTGLGEADPAGLGEADPAGLGEADPAAVPASAGAVFCHNDLCPENVVFRDGRAVALLDFDVAAPGRAVWDVARTARMWVPAAVPGSSRSWPGRPDVWRRVAVLTAAYGLVPADGEEFADLLLAATRQGQDWVRAKVEAGDPAFVEMWQRFGLADRYAADLAWIADQRASLAAAVGSART